MKTHELLDLMSRLNELKISLREKSDYALHTIDFAQRCASEMLNINQKQVENRPVVHEWKHLYAQRASELLKTLESAERDGWEVVSINYTYNDGYQIFAKRQK